MLSTKEMETPMKPAVKILSPDKSQDDEEDDDKGKEEIADDDELFRHEVDAHCKECKPSARPREWAGAGTHVDCSASQRASRGLCTLWA